MTVSAHLVLRASPIMRALILLLALSASVGVSAQSGDDPIPDPTPPEQYYPLAVGNEWVFVAVEGGVAYREVVIRDTLVGGETFAVVERSVIGSDPSEPPLDRTRFFVRVDAETAHVVYLRDGVERTDGCPLDADFSADPYAGRPVDCGTETVTLRGGIDQPVEMGLPSMDPLVARMKRFVTDDGAEVGYAAGVGRVVGSPSVATGDEREWVGRIVYARIDGQAFGLIPREDPTDPAFYVPLAVGTEREEFRGVAGTYLRTRRVIAGDTLVADVRYVIEETFVAGITVPEWGEPSVRLLRFDERTAQVFERRPDGSERSVTCPLGTPFDVIIPCPGEYGQATVVGGAVGTYALSVGEDTVFLPALKGHGSLAWYADVGSLGPYGAGIGRLPQTDFAGCYPPICFEEITYLRTVDADGSTTEYGARYAVASDNAPEAGTLALQAGPNPTSGSLTLVLDLPTAAAVALEAFDALGRRVWTQEISLGAGRQRVSVDASSWAPGLYVVRARTDRTSATTTVVRR